MKQGDVLSKETQFAGLPKIIKARASALSTVAVNSWSFVSLDTVDINYGGFTLDAGQVVIPEPGIYAYAAQTLINGNVAGGTIALSSYVNGSFSAIGSIFGFGTEQSGSNGVSAAGWLELKTGDHVSFVLFGNGGFSTLAQFSTLTLKKEPGVY